MSSNCDVNSCVHRSEKSMSAVSNIYDPDADLSENEQSLHTQEITTGYQPYESSKEHTKESRDRSRSPCVSTTVYFDATASFEWAQ